MPSLTFWSPPQELQGQDLQHPMPPLTFWSPLRELKGQIWACAKDPQGCRYLQNLLQDEDASHDDRRAMFKELLLNVKEALNHPEANHVVQKCIQMLPANDSQPVIDAIRGTAQQRARKRCGCQYMQRLLERCGPEQLKDLHDELLSCWEALILDENGVFVMECFLKNASIPHALTLVQRLQGFVMCKGEKETAQENEKENLKKLVRGSAFLFTALSEDRIDMKERVALAITLLNISESKLKGLAMMRFGVKAYIEALTLTAPEAAQGAEADLAHAGALSVFSDPKNISTLKTVREGRTILKHVQELQKKAGACWALQEAAVADREATQTELEEATQMASNKHATRLHQAAVATQKPVAGSKEAAEQGALEKAAVEAVIVDTEAAAQGALEKATVQEAIQKAMAINAGPAKQAALEKAAVEEPTQKTVVVDKDAGKQGEPMGGWEKKGEVRWEKQRRQWQRQAEAAEADKRYEGTVKTFKGAFGFIESREYKDSDVFVHKKFSFGDGEDCSLAVGDVVTFRVVLKPDAPNQGQAQAHDVQVK